MSNKDEPAFPVQSFTIQNGEIVWGEPGLTKREWFAGMALQGLLANPGIDSDQEGLPVEAVQYADALLAALEKGNQ